MVITTIDSRTPRSYDADMRKPIILLVTVIVMAISSPAYPSGFAIIEQSVKGLGNAYAGGSAVCEDATAIFFNPAGLARLQGHEVVAGIHVVMPEVFKSVGYDPEQYSGFAFGMGVERIAMLKYGIKDLRLFFENDVVRSDRDPKKETWKR